MGRAADQGGGKGPSSLTFQGDQEKQVCIASACLFVWFF